MVYAEASLVDYITDVDVDSVPCGILGHLVCPYLLVCLFVFFYPACALPRAGPKRWFWSTYLRMHTIVLEVHELETH